MPMRVFPVAFALFSGWSSCSVWSWDQRADWRPVSSCAWRTMIRAASGSDNAAIGGPCRFSHTLVQLQVVNQLGIETYLASVVGSEMPHQWPLAALQAQAVAARTYALKQRGGGRGWDVKATVASQMYRGVESETDSTREAVRSTSSLVLVHGGRLIDAVFHSSSGGATEASGMVWRQQLPYLVSVPDHDQHSPVHRWQGERFDAETLRQRLPETGGLDSVDVLSRSGSGRVVRRASAAHGECFC